MSNKDILEDKINKKEPFSIHSLMNENSVDLLEAKKIVKLAMEDDKLTKYFIFVCPKCGNNCGDGIFEKTIYGRLRNCFGCKEKFKTSEKNTEIIFDSRTLKEKINI